MTATRTTGVLFLALLAGAAPLPAAEGLWIEAEHLDGIRGYCWPMGPPERKTTRGHWGLSGPGWAAEWNQGGESGFLSIAAGAADDKAVASKTVEVPVAGTYFVWVRYGDWREKAEPFEVRIAQGGAADWTGRFGTKAVVEEDNVMKLYWSWAFAWDRRTTRLKKGPATIRLASAAVAPEPRQVDVIVLTTDGAYRPFIKERPANPAWDVLESYRGGIGDEVEPLTRRRGGFALPDRWRVRTFRDKGFLYLWNVGSPDPLTSWLSDKPDRIRVPYRLGDRDALKEFEAKYAGKESGIPIFSDDRVAPLFHGVGPVVFRTDEKTGELTELGKRFDKWLDENPKRCWGGMMNYAPGRKIGPKGVEAFRKHRARYVGSVAGESLGYFTVDGGRMKRATAEARTRRQLVEAFTPLTLATNAAKYRDVFGRDLDKNPYQDVIACLSVGNIAFAPLCSRWGARTIGYESSAMTSSLLAMRWAFLRGAARQGGHLTATYRSCNFGDSSTIFTGDTHWYTRPRNILDNYYSVYSGAGMTWYKMDIWYQYMAGASMFYHEQGFDEFWKPGGTSAAGVRPVGLSPKGKLVDRFLRVTARHGDRGTPYTPVAFLVDYAHGWEPSPFWPNAFKNWHGHQERFRPGDHEAMLDQYFRTAWYPIGPESAKPITALNEVYLPGVFGDVFDVIFACPDVNRWTTIGTYRAVIAAGEIDLTAAEGRRLAKYVADGGTLLVADAHLTGPGAAALKLPAAGKAVESAGYRWLGDPAVHPSGRFRCRPIRVDGGRTLARTPEGATFCAAVDRGAGRLIYLSVPHGLDLSRRAVPAVARLLAHLTRGVMPVEVAGDVEWMVNRTAAGWAVTLLNPAGQHKAQQGISPTDFRANRPVVIRSRGTIRSASDRLMPGETLLVKDNAVRLVVPAGGVRIVELR